MALIDTRDKSRDRSTLAIGAAATGFDIRCQQVEIRAMHSWPMSIAVFGCLLAGCAKTPPPIVAASTSPSPLAVVTDLPPGAVIMKSVKGIDCAKSPLDPTPTQPIALEQLKKNAEALGATGIAGLEYHYAGISISPACWQSTRAKALAYRLDKAKRS